jgi:hypothetical protein
MSASAKNERLQQLAALVPAVARLREIVTQSQDALLTEGEVHPDHELLDLCATALHHLRHAQRAWDERNTAEWLRLEGAPLAAALARDGKLMAAWYEGNRNAKPSLLRISKMKARTAAGIYAKAMVVRASKTGAAGLAMTLAADLLDCPGLRESLWPAELPSEPATGD